MSGMIICIKQLWMQTDKCQIKDTTWNGWLLAYLTRNCFPGCSIRDTSSNPIKAKYISTVDKLIEKLVSLCLPNSGTIICQENLINMKIFVFFT